MSIKGALGILAAEQGIDLALLDLSLPDATGFSGFLRLERPIRGSPSRSSRAMRTSRYSRSAVAGCRRLFAEIDIEERIGALDRAGAEWLYFRSEQFRGPERS